MKKYSYWAIYILSASAVLIFCLVGIPRFLYPYEIHWLEGSMVDQIARIHSGNPLYSRPSMEYVPWLYGPGYYYAAAAVSWITGVSFVAARIPSLIATIGTLLLLFVAVKKETFSITASIAAVGLYLAAYVKTELNMLHARVDPLFLFFVVASIIIIYYSTSWKGILAGSLLLAAGFFTKQSSIIFTGGIIIYLWKTQGWKPATIFLGATVLFIVIGTVILDCLFDGWFTYYTITIPQVGKARTVGWEFAISGFLEFALLRCWAIALVAVCVSSKRFISKNSVTKRRDPVLAFGLFFASTAAAGFLGILNQGGNHNVFLPMAAGCALFLPILIFHPQAHKPISSALFWAVPIQIGLLLSNPWSSNFNIASGTDRIKQEQFNTYVASLSGEVWIPFHGYVWHAANKKNYADLNALRDVLLVGDSVSNRLQQEYDSTLFHHRFDYILSDIPTSYPHYRLLDSMMNNNRVWMTLISDSMGRYLISPMLYRYVPQ